MLGKAIFVILWKSVKRNFEKTVARTWVVIINYILVSSVKRSGAKVVYQQTNDHEML